MGPHDVGLMQLKRPAQDVTPAVLYAGDDEVGQVVTFVGRGDTTLLVHPPDGGWRCNDDSHGTLHPTVDLSRPRAGQYDVWVGSYRRGEAVEGRLYVTESVDRHP